MKLTTIAKYVFVLIVSTSILVIFSQSVRAAAPTDIKLDGADSESINENRPVGSHFSILTSVDADANDHHRYSLVAGSGDTDNGSFAISGNRLIANTVFDFETKTTYSIRIQTEDKGGSTYAEAFTVSIVDIMPEISTVETEVWDFNAPGTYLVSDAVAAEVAQGIGQLKRIFTSQSIAGDLGLTVDVVMADFDKDGDLDIYAANGGNNGQNKLWINDGAGNFTNNDIVGDDLGFSSKITIADVNGDTYPDIYVATTNNQQNRLWINDGAGNFTNNDITGDTGTFTQKGLFGDLDGDTDLDLYVLNHNGTGSRQNTLWLNDGSGNFTVGPIIGGSDSSHAGFLGDVDGDTDLDIYVGNYNQQNKLWINDGGGNFTASDISGDLGHSVSTAMVDLDGDTDLDIYVANSNLQQNRLWINDGNGNFTANDITGDLGWSSSVALGDVDNDTDLDIHVGNDSQQNRLWINDGAGNFIANDIAGDTGTPFDVAMGDVDNDNDLDIYVGIRNQQNRLWINDGSGNFTANDIPGDLGDSMPVALGDVDNDNDLDIYVGNYNQQNKLWINDYATTSPYLQPVSAVAFSNWVNTFVEIVAVDHTGSLGYQVSTDNSATWHYWTGAAWAATSATDGSQTSSAAVINANIPALDTDGGLFTWRSYLFSNGKRKIELDQIAVTHSLPTTTPVPTPTMSATSMILLVLTMIGVAVVFIRRDLAAIS